MSWRCSWRSLTCPGGPGPVLEVLTVSNVRLRYITFISPVKLHTARISTGLMLQGRDQDRKLRNNLLSTTMGGLGGAKKGFKVV